MTQYIDQRIKRFALLILVLPICIAAKCTPEPVPEPVSYAMSAEEPVLIWEGIGYDYLYEQSIVYTGQPDGLYYMYSCGTGANYGIPWDRIKLSKSDDGNNWTPPEVTLGPTPDGQDWVAACNPSVFADSETGYWYMLYTAATVPDLDNPGNAIFAARSVDPNGPWDRWNGSGWGGSPQWIIPPDDDAVGCTPENNVGCYGIGEPSAVLALDRIYVFFSQWNHSGLYEAVWVFTPGENWPLQLEGGAARTGKILFTRKRTSRRALGRQARRRWGAPKVHGGIEPSIQRAAPSARFR